MPSPAGITPASYRAHTQRLWGTATTAPSTTYRRELALAASKSATNSAAPASFDPFFGLFARRNSCGQAHVGRRHYDGSPCNSKPLRRKLVYNAGSARIRTMRHRVYDGVRCNVPNVKHHNLDHIGCGVPVVRHAAIDDLTVSCNPNDAAVLLPIERLGVRFANLFTETRIHCELTGIPSPISVGDIVDTKEYGRAVVVDYVLAERTEQYLEWRGNEIGDRGRVKTRTYFAIKSLVVQGTKVERNRIVGVGLTFSSVELKKDYVTFELSPEETKEIFIQRLIERGESEMLTLVYPEERKNFDSWVAKFPPRTLRERSPEEWARPRAGRVIEPPDPPKKPTPPRRRRTRPS